MKYVGNMGNMNTTLLKAVGVDCCILYVGVIFLKHRLNRRLCTLSGDYYCIAGRLFCEALCKSVSVD